MIRESCKNCAIKHFATAIVLLEEAQQGYPSHKLLALGHLNEASNELLASFPEMAGIIRDIRRNIWDGNETVDLMSILKAIYELKENFK